MKKNIGMVLLAILVGITASSISAANYYSGALQQVTKTVLSAVNGPAQTVSTTPGQIQSATGVLTSTGTSVSNSSTAVPFTITNTNGILYLVQCDAASCVIPGTTASCAVGNAAQGLKLAANDQAYFLLNPGQTSISAISVAGTSNCAVWQVK